MQHWNVDPSNPSAPPRLRPIPLVNKAKGGVLHRTFGGKDIFWTEKPKPVPRRSNPYKPSPMPQLQPNSHSATQGLQTGQNLDAISSPALGLDVGYLPPTGLPEDFRSLPWRERRYYEKMLADQIRASNLWEKAERQRMKAEDVERKTREKQFEKRWRKELKEEEKALRRQRKNPGLFFPPFSTPADPVTGTIAPQNRSQAQKPTMPHQPVSWMMMPTLEEFGIRRPFDAPGRPSGVGGPSGQGQWPMMSRTMTHAMVDMNREEKMKMMQSGLAWSPTW